ncbi:MAG TPA: hypothetical protein VGS22_17095 [Thermoanaerobaculia bacterium]|jgi:hypothetical protein|nr:hypothetical protein [Thermoanaerobaculia bacterium]
MSATAASSAAGRPRSERLRLAIEDFYARSTRRGHPEGDWQDGLWYPSASERQACCEGIEPTLANRQALESHCRTQAHVAALYDVPVGELKAAVRDDRKQGSPIAERVASTFVGPRPRSTETFAELRQKGRDEAFEKLRAVLAQGLPLFERLRTLPNSEEQDAMEHLLETASESAERLLATINSARRQEVFMACASAFLETLKTTLEEPKGKGRRGTARSTPRGEEAQV